MSRYRYRDNKLTQLMSDSLGGNAKTLMFVNISPVEYNADETHAALVYAARVKLITNSAQRQQETVEIRRLKAIIATLRGGGGGVVTDEIDADCTDAVFDGGDGGVASGAGTLGLLVGSSEGPGSDDMAAAIAAEEALP